ncbi:hypothetical protein C1645_816321 [Glomus cerebriforme]|uniref:Uncharacterized protein n=1 Tax=Glomus cerebriforme TaxID=658196 RepID=A0A397TCV4_9GLOM|nr:hypothetical protein C1645_816321 [Glomus cerebriforme]
MSTRQFKRNSICQYELNSFLRYLNYDNIHLFPFNNDPNKIATHVRLTTTINILTGKDLLKWNVQKEARRLQLRNRHVIDLATDKIWCLKCKNSQRQQFENLAKDANIINQNIRRVNDDTRKSISQINVRQVINEPLFDNFYNGTINFSDNNDLESLILPCGTLEKI